MKSRYSAKSSSRKTASTQGSRKNTNKRHKRNFDNDLRSRIARQGGPTGFSILDDDVDTAADATQNLGLYGTARRSSNHREPDSSLEQTRLFPSPDNPSNRTPASRKSVHSRFSKATMATGQASNIHGTTSSALVHVVCAISENLARETCIASLDASSPIQLHVSKQGNGQTYSETIACLEILRPNEILLNEGRSNSQLARKILEIFPQQGNGEIENGGGVIVKFISRAFFDQTRGADLLRKVAHPKTYDPSVVEEYILLSASYAVLHYTQSSLGASFAKHTLFLSVNVGGLHRMTLDRSTILQLELLVNAKTARVASSLIASIDKTKTTVGSRLLRSNLMSPSSSAGTIQTRLELVDTFLGDTEFFFTVLEHLQALPDVDKMLSNLTLKPKRPDQGDGTAVNLVQARRVASRGISSLVCLKATLTSLQSLISTLQTHLNSLESRLNSTASSDIPGPEGSGNDARTERTDDCSSLLLGMGRGNGPAQRFHLLKAILYTLSQPQLQDILQAVTDIFTQTTIFSRNAHIMRHQECFALKCEDSDLMQVLRKAFLGNVDDIYRKADEYAEIHGIHVQVRYSTNRGYFLAVPGEVGSALPSVFLQPAKQGRFITCTTEEISSLNSRTADNMHDLLLMTHDRSQDVMDVARSHYDILAALCDAVALLDMCHSFADHVTLVKTPWCRPVVTEITRGETAAENLDTAFLIRNGRFAIEVEGSDTSYVPNDTYAAANKSLTVVSGINGSGKSTYLKQIAIITVLAQCGSYVPADQASIPIRDRLCCRIGNADDQEHNISTFLVEMKETAFICNHADERSLVLIDELGRATSNEDGVAIAWATCEYLIKKRALSFFVTHYSQLTRLVETYPRLVQNVHLSATVESCTAINSSEETIGSIQYTHKVQAGACQVSAEYGVELAGHCGWSMEVFKSASETHRHVESLIGDETVCENSTDDYRVHASNHAIQILNKVLSNLQYLVSGEETLSLTEIRQRMKQLDRGLLQVANSRESRERLLAAMNHLLVRRSTKQTLLLEQSTDQDSRKPLDQNLETSAASACNDEKLVADTTDSDTSSLSSSSSDTSGSSGTCSS